jgi:hypothetical protein
VFVADLAGGGVGLVFVTHHALLDGIGGLAVLVSSGDGAPPATGRAAPSTTSRSSPPPVRCTRSWSTAARRSTRSCRGDLARQRGATAPGPRPGSRGARGTAAAHRGEGPCRAPRGGRAFVDDPHGPGVPVAGGAGPPAPVPDPPAPDPLAGEQRDRPGPHDHHRRRPGARDRSGGRRQCRERVGRLPGAVLRRHVQRHGDRGPRGGADLPVLAAALQEELDALAALSGRGASPW